MLANVHIKVVFLSLFFHFFIMFSNCTFSFHDDTSSVLVCVTLVRPLSLWEWCMSVSETRGFAAQYAKHATAGSPPKRGNYTEQWVSFWISQSKNNLFISKLSYRKAKIETPEEVLMRLNAHKDVSAQKTTRGKEEEDVLAAPAFPARINADASPHPPSWFSSDSWGITRLNTLICLQVSKSFFPSSKRGADYDSPQTTDTNWSLKLPPEFQTPPTTQKLLPTRGGADFS